MSGYGLVRGADTAPLIGLRGPASGLGAQLLLLGALSATTGLGPAGWTVGLACALLLDVALARALRRRAGRLGPAGWVTLTRASLAVGVAALTADSFGDAAHVRAIVALASVALVLDVVDGRVARRTGTASQLGARFDGEVDAFLIMALAVAATPAHGAWVLLIGLARYAFLLGEWLLPWMSAQLPARTWRRIVAAVQGVMLTVAVSGVLPEQVTRAGLAVALLLLAESFGRDTWWLWRHRRVGPRDRAARPAGLSIAVTVLSFTVVWAALILPNQPDRLTPGAFVRIPLEGVLVLAAALLLPVPGRRALAWLAGPLLGLVLFTKLLDIGFFTAFDRPFNPVDDWSYASIGVETMRDSIGRAAADLALLVLTAVAVAALILPALALLRVTRIAAGHRSASLAGLTVLGMLWLASWAAGAEVVAGVPVAATSAADMAMAEVRAVQAGIRDHARFAAEIRNDRYRSAPGSQLLTDLRGKDVLLVFVESYGRYAVDGASFSPQVQAALAQGTSDLETAGFSSRSAWMESPTFGGISWLAHSTMQSGTWVDTKGRYDQLLGSDRFTLSQAFGRAGWRTVYEVPANDRDWAPAKTFYGYDAVYDRRNVGYRGPAYAYAPMPDQYVLAALQRLELAKRPRPPVFAEVDLVSSHTPWTRTPPLISWSEVGDGSVFASLPVDTTGRGDVGQGYAHSIVYSLRTLVSFVQHDATTNTVLIVLGDHQPAHVVSGYGVTHDVPVSIIARDPKVMARIARWGWVDGLRPPDSAPVWRMSAFRDRFLSAFGSRPAG